MVLERLIALQRPVGRRITVAQTSFCSVPQLLAMLSARVSGDFGVLAASGRPASAVISRGRLSLQEITTAGRKANKAVLAFLNKNPQYSFVRQPLYWALTFDSPPSHKSTFTAQHVSQPRARASRFRHRNFLCRIGLNVGLSSAGKLNPASKKATIHWLDKVWRTPKSFRNRLENPRSLTH